MPNQNWDDWALTQQFAALNKRLEMHEHALEGLSHFPTDVAIAAREIEHLTREIQGVAATCTGFHEEWQRSVEGEQKNRNAFVVAAIGGICVVLASLVTVVATLLGGG